MDMITPITTSANIIIIHNIIILLKFEVKVFV